MDKKYLSKITVGGQQYDLKDAEARQSIIDLQASVTGGMHYIGETSTALTDGSATSTLVANSEGSLSKTTGFEAGDIVIYGELEFVWNGASWQEFGSTGSLKALAFKDSATGSVTAAGSNAASNVTLTGGSTAKLVTTTITGTNGTESVSKVTKTDGKLDTVSITGVDGTESVSKVTKTGSKLVTTTITGTNGTDTVHDTPTLTKSSIGSASGWNAGTMFSASVNEANELLTLSAGTVPSLTVTSTEVGTGLTAGTEKTFAKVASAATTVATGAASSSGTGSAIITAVTISDKTVAKAASEAITVATGSVSASGEGSAVVTGVTISDKTVAKAASSATTVATGTASASGTGSTVATALPTGGTAAAQTFTGSAVSVTVA